jgi:hypothetical protein
MVPMSLTRRKSITTALVSWVSAVPEPAGHVNLLRRCTYSGRPFGEEEFVERLETEFQRKWRRWTFEKALGAAVLT